MLNKFLNQKGASLLMVLSVSAVMMTSSLVLMKQWKNADGERLNFSYKEQEKRVDRSVNDYLSSSADCKNAFATLTYANDKLTGFDEANFNQNLTTSITNRGLVKFDSVFISSSTLEAPSTPVDPVYLPMKETVVVRADLIVKTNRRNTEGSLNSNKTTTTIIPITFEFNNATKSLVSCGTFSSNNEDPRKTSCLAVGGNYSENNNICFMPSHGSGANMYVFEDKYSVQDALCLMDHNLKKQIDANPDELFTSNCARPRYGGCVSQEVDKFKKNYDKLETNAYIKPSQVEDYVNAVYTYGVFARRQRLMSQFQKAASNSPILVNGYDMKKVTADLYGLELTADAAIDIWSADGWEVALTPLKLLQGTTGIALAVPEYLLDGFLNLSIIPGCDSRKKIISQGTCMKGNIELDRMEIQTKRRRARCWGRCCWRKESAFSPPTIEATAASIKNGILSKPEGELPDGEPGNEESSPEAAAAALAQKLDQARDLTEFYSIIDATLTDLQTLEITLDDLTKGVMIAKQTEAWASLTVSVDAMRTKMETSTTPKDLIGEATSILNGAQAQRDANLAKIQFIQSPDSTISTALKNLSAKIDEVKALP